VLPNRKGLHLRTVKSADLCAAGARVQRVRVLLRDELCAKETNAKSAERKREREKERKREREKERESEGGREIGRKR